MREFAQSGSSCSAAVEVCVTKFLQAVETLSVVQWQDCRKAEKQAKKAERKAQKRAEKEAKMEALLAGGTKEKKGWF